MSLYQKFYDMSQRKKSIFLVALNIISSSVISFAFKKANGPMGYVIALLSMAYFFVLYKILLGLYSFMDNKINSLRNFKDKAYCQAYIAQQASIAAANRLRKLIEAGQMDDKLLDLIELDNA